MLQYVGFFRSWCQNRIKSKNLHEGHLCNDEAYAPNLDRITASGSTVVEAVTVSDEQEDIIELTPGAKYTYTLYEAENAVIGNGATNETTLVGWIGGASYVLFDNIELL